MKKILISLLLISLASLTLSAEESKKKSVEFKPYGFIQLNAQAQDATFTASDLMIFVADETKGHLNYNVRDTRIGTKILFPSIEKVKLSGTIEVDFYGDFQQSGAAESRPQLRMRHGFIDLGKNFGDTTLGLIAGSTWAPATPNIFPTAVGTPGGWAIGNIWQRMPQIQLYATHKIGVFTTGIKAAATRAMTGKSLSKGGGIETLIDAGDAATFPLIQAQLFAKGKVAGITIDLGVGAAYGKEDYSLGESDVKVKGKDENGNDVQNSVDGSEVDVQLINAGLKISHQYANISGKFYTGKNINIFGSLASNATSDYNDSQNAIGYFAQVGITPIKGVALNAGMGTDDPDEEQENASVSYKKNSAMWTNLFYTLYSRYRVGAQYMKIETEKSDKTLTGNSYMLTFKLSF